MGAFARDDAGEVNRDLEKMLVLFPRYAERNTQSVGWGALERRAANAGARARTDEQADAARAGRAHHGTRTANGAAGP